MRSHPGRRTLFALLALVALAASAQRIVPTIDFSAMKLEITWVRTNAQIEEARKEYGAEIEQEGNRRLPQKPEGFAVLVRRAGEVVCRLWVLKPENVDDQRTTALGHELLHCALGDYHRGDTH
jgi:hypothetical protein